MLTDTPARHALSEHAFTSFDGTRLFYRAWLPSKPASRALLLFHRGHEHSARWRETVNHLRLRDTAVFAWDQRGHGRSPGERGHAPGIAAVIKDADWWARHVERTHGIALKQTAVVASSAGAVIAAAWVHDFAPPIRGMVLAAPALRVKLYVPFAVTALRLKEKFLPGGNVKSYVKSRMLTHDAEQAALYDEDTFIFRQIAINILLDLHDTGTRLLADAGAIQTPTLLLGAGKDWVVKLSAQQQFFQRLGSRIKQFEVYPDAYHSLFHETERVAIARRIRTFIESLYEKDSGHLDQNGHAHGNGHANGNGNGHGAEFTLQRAGPEFSLPRIPASNGHSNGNAAHTPPAANLDREALLHADEGGYTRTEYDLLRAPGSPHWAVVRASLKLLAPLSRGVALGFKAGFDSGHMLDYIYQNQAQGRTLLGRLIDRFYLNAIGWRGIRLRRANLQRLLRVAIEYRRRAGESVHILDIAAGPGRYVLETVADLHGPPISAHLRDYQQSNVDAARRLAALLALDTITAECADAFDVESYATLSPRPTIAIASGIFELFPQNAPVRRALQGIASATDPGALLLYTNQPWHPQLEFIARTLPNREGNPWIMRRRTQAEIDALVRAAGFEKVEQEIDPWGIFTVSLARRVG